MEQNLFTCLTDYTSTVTSQKQQPALAVTSRRLRNPDVLKPVKLVSL